MIADLTILFLVLAPETYLSRTCSRFFEQSMKGDRDVNLHFSPGNFTQVLGIENQEISRVLSCPRAHHHTENYTCESERNKAMLNFLKMLRATD